MPNTITVNLHSGLRPDQIATVIREFDALLAEFPSSVLQPDF